MTEMDVDSPQDAVVYASEDAVGAVMAVFHQLVRAQSTLDSRFVWRALKELALLRGQTGVLSRETLITLVDTVYPGDSQFKKPLLRYVNHNVKTGVTDSQGIRAQLPATFYQVVDNQSRIEVAPLVNSFVFLLVQLYLLDSDQLGPLNEFNLQVVIPKILYHNNNRLLDLINAKLWFYCVIAQERLGLPAQAAVRAEMIKFVKVATLKHDNETKGMLINLILRNFLARGEVEHAADFVNKVEFPSNTVSSPLEARFFFYLAKIMAIQLNYSSASEYIVAAIRKAPHNDKSLGFLQQANKLHGVIQLLMGDIPELSFFHQPKLSKSLYLYYHLTNSVKIGDLKKFTSTITKYKQQLIKDGNYQLCVRLRSNVIKTGIRIISLTYKKISLKDICLKLKLDSEQTAEYMVARCIRDGVIEAKINHELGYIETSELLNIYDTTDPQETFNERINFVTQMHNESVLAMRYPDDGKLKKNAQEDSTDAELIEEVSDFSDLDDLEFL
ncbi:proteasome regulatory particle lid subunit RPN3 KNAG_0D05170 [Huiozyma naganishii CBS 8797]|uniref:PCI domain-containing protein n=1 Tax=Huiozyma naganishii (strain ATCC MYA-139 / BCRC 22969 / CBS 8797 / KCTC 17520 / NBRC 10181 / NCYC 3082 / Yp74L-3) TaxID=1071383 RepID=J7R5W7_HUIN7|nr:hypothetical protein KNAG_0D05170 [Kazachstania naganishii CBS 8797]CCK70255.1 hypothetical protein KNAG_0D05170 [Kazachstania naganishii CBS 8797]